MILQYQYTGHQCSKQKEVSIRWSFHTYHQSSNNHYGHKYTDISEPYQRIERLDKDFLHRKDYTHLFHARLRCLLYVSKSSGRIT